MALLRLVAEKVGPFEERLDLDFSDGAGNPHLGPHILAGINGSGKSTALRTIAWVIAEEGDGFDFEDWTHMLRGPGSRACCLFEGPEGELFQEAVCVTRDASGPETWMSSLRKEWQRNGGPRYDFSTYPHWQRLEIRNPRRQPEPKMTFHWSAVGKSAAMPFRNCVAYGPSLSLRYIEEIDLSQRRDEPFDNQLAFESTVRNDRVQAWLAGLFAKRALASDRGEPAEYYRRQVNSLTHAISNAFEEQIGFDIDHKSLQPLVTWRGRSLNFSQLPAGIRNIIGWIADFMRRQEMWGERGTTETGVLILDEIDSHLHPRWQRTLLPALREALPKVQIIVATHSPFVISSCKDARIHVLGLDAEGRATKPEIHDARVGSSVSAVLTDIFDVPTEFDVETERELEEWNELKKAEAAKSITRVDSQKLQKLTSALSQKSEELRFLVESPPRLSRALLEQIMPDKKKGSSAGQNGKAAGRRSRTREKSG